MGFLKGCYGNSLWYSYGISIDSSGISMVFLGCSHDISMWFLCGFY